MNLIQVKKKQPTTDKRHPSNDINGSNQENDPSTLSTTKEKAIARLTIYCLSFFSVPNCRGKQRKSGTRLSRSSFSQSSWRWSWPWKSDGDHHPHPQVSLPSRYFYFYTGTELTGRYGRTWQDTQRDRTQHNKAHKRTEARAERGLFLAVGRGRKDKKIRQKKKKGHLIKYSQLSSTAWHGMGWHRMAWVRAQGTEQNSAAKHQKAFTGPKNRKILGRITTRT